MSLNFIDVLAVMANYAAPLVVIVGVVAFAVRKLNSLERKINKLEKLINEKGIKLDE
jgi:hypothetical protein